MSTTRYVSHKEPCIWIQLVITMMKMIGGKHQRTRRVLQNIKVEYQRFNQWNRMYGCWIIILEFQVAVANCSLAEGKINRCRVCLFHSQGYIAVYGYSTYSSYTTQWTWKYSQLYSITLNEQTLTLQLYIRYSHHNCCFKKDLFYAYLFNMKWFIGRNKLDW